MLWSLINTLLRGAPSQDAFLHRITQQDRFFLAVDDILSLESSEIGVYAPTDQKLRLVPQHVANLLVHIKAAGGTEPLHLYA